MLVRVGKEGKERAEVMRKVLKRLLVGYEEDPETTEISMGRKSLDLKSLCRSRNPYPYPYPYRFATIHTFVLGIFVQHVHCASRTSQNT